MTKRTLQNLTDAQVRNSSPGKIADGGGLWLHRRADEGAHWFLRVTVYGRRREMGLGGYPKVSLKEAREKAAVFRAQARAGVDPIRRRQRERQDEQRQLHLLKDIAEDCFKSRKSSLKGDGRNGRWFSPLELHVLPKLGKVPVVEIDQIYIRETLAPIWHDKAPTAEKAMNRLNLCIKHAAALGLNVDLQAVEKARALLGQQDHETKHIESLPWEDVPEFYATLNDGTTTQLALRYLILTGMRSMPIRFCRFDQVEGDIWTVPAEYMKSLKGKATDFRALLSQEAQCIVEQAKPIARDGWVFPSVRKGVISDATMSKYMKDKGMDARPHGFRTSFRTWCADVAEAPHEVAETAIAHTPDSKVVRAYRRTDFLKQRRILMQRWADHVCGRSGEVVKIA